MEKGRASFSHVAVKLETALKMSSESKVADE